MALKPAKVHKPVHRVPLLVAWGNLCILLERAELLWMGFCFSITNKYMNRKHLPTHEGLDANHMWETSNWPKEGKWKGWKLYLIWIAIIFAGLIIAGMVGNESVYDENYQPPERPFYRGDY